MCAIRQAILGVCVKSLRAELCKNDTNTTITDATNPNDCVLIKPF